MPLRVKYYNASTGQDIAIMLNASPEYYFASAGQCSAIMQLYLMLLPSIILPLQVNATPIVLHDNIMVNIEFESPL